MYQEREVSNLSARFDQIKTIGMNIVVLTVILCTALRANAAAGQLIAHNTPAYVATARNLGAEDPSKIIEVSIWLNPHNRSEMDALGHDLYDRTSPNYRHWLTRLQIAERFAPTP